MYRDVAGVLSYFESDRGGVVSFTFTFTIDVFLFFIFGGKVRRVFRKI